ncbi:hypothetical protein [Marinimicrobium agarilyticum]|uniref:hypothetical protein n=1 Tax=Marinimicrobium agarilyticum TaxID=306546 RepID=UPI000487F563|nr:hypothetical protein [Marinimicrobium agarilyticum]
MNRLCVAKGCLISLAFATSACGFAEALPDNSDSGDNQAIFSTLFDHLDYRFPEQQNCSDEKTTSIKEFTAHSLAYMSEQKPGHGSVKVKCDHVQASPSLANFYSADIFPENAEEAIRKLDEKDSLMQCQVSFSVSDKEVVWSRSIQFLWNEKAKDAIKETFRCVLIP